MAESLSNKERKKDKKSGSVLLKIISSNSTRHNGRQFDEHHDDFPKDDASLEILTESGDSHTRDSKWSIYSPSRSSRSSIAGSEMSLMDFQKVSIHSKIAPIVHPDGRQFIEQRDLNAGGLPYSAEFYLNGEVWKLSGEDCFLMSPRRYIAEVSVDGTIDLKGAAGFEEAVRTLLKHLKVEKVLLDKELEECNKTKSALKMTLDKLTDQSGEKIERKRDVMLLLMLLKKHGNSLNINFKNDLRNCSRLSSEIMSTLDNYVTKALEMIQRNEFLGHLNDSSLSDEFINDAIQEALNHHQTRLAVICPPSMKDKLKELPDDRILYVTKDDLHLFTDLTTLDEAIFKTVLPMIFSKFLTRVEQINDEQFNDLDPLSNRIFLYVCKSLQEVAKELKAQNAIMYSEPLGWEVTNLQEEPPTLYKKCLRQQLQMLAKLANHFEPGGPFRTTRFPYEFKLFQNMEAVPEPERIWLCLLDDCLKDLVQAKLNKMQMLSFFFKSFVSFVASVDFRSETLECLRTITHGALRSLADMASYQQDQNTSDLASLESYNQMISCCLGKFPKEHFGNECHQIETMLQQIICKAMDMDVSSDELSKFSNEFKQLLNDLSDLQLEWFIRLTPSDKRYFLLISQFIAPVDNIWKDTEDECFKVVDLGDFIEVHKLLYNSEEMPKHYQLKVIQVLLQNLDELVSNQSWNAGKRLSDKDLLGAMTIEINSIRSSLFLLKEQPDYCQFEEFLLKMSKPCNQAMKQEVQEHPHTIAIDAGETLDPLLYRFKGSIGCAFLKDGLTVYTTQFNKHIAETERLSCDEKIEKIVSDVKSKIEPMLATSWTAEFKRNELPKVLAGLSAVWSVTENNNSLGKMKKPSLLQISCVLRFFGDIDDYNICYSHQLLQLSTQEGKEFVLRLTAAALALYGHNVHILCFNSNLSSLTSPDWIEVFKSFSIRSNISYESLEDMARERSKGVYEKYMAYINECLGLKTNANHNNDQKNASEDERSVLLIEDIDIILQEGTLSMPYRRSVRPTIPGLEEVERRLFLLNELEDVNELELSGYPDIRELRAFLDRPHSYTLLEGNPFEEVEYTNKTLYLKHLEAMKSAKNMEGYNAGDHKYGCFSLGYIPFPYQHLLKSFPLVLGFASEPLEVVGGIRFFLTLHYTLYTCICVSDISQIIPTKFNPKKDFLHIDSKDECVWIEAIVVAIKAAIDRNCLVLVFFKGAQKMEQVQQKEYLKQLNVTAIKTASNLENLFEHYISNDEISVLMVCNGKFSKDRQVHVIQTFFSEDGTEENLIRRQAERTNSRGSYELIIPSIRDMSRYVLTYTNRTPEITYEWLVRNRRYLTYEELRLCFDLSSDQYNKIKKFLKL